MTNFKPTPEQQNCIDLATNSRENLVVIARAGAAKTTTLELMANALAPEQILCLAFNKAIAEEMKARLPKTATAMTLSSLGYRSWQTFLSRRPKVFAGKMHSLIKEWIGLHVTSDELEEFYEDYDYLKEAISIAKAVGYIPDAFKHPQFSSLMNDGEFYDILTYAPSELHADCIEQVLIKSIRDALEGTIDYDDMLYLPTLCRSCSFPYHSTVMVDEAQDLSPLNHAMLRKLLKGRARLIAVGDPCQAIYGFRGASQNSIAELKRDFSMKEATLTISFRCPIAVVKEAHWRAPDMRWPDWAIEGKVSIKPTWSVDDLPDRAVIICRNNAPLFRQAIRLLKAGRYPQLVGSDISISLKKVMQKLGVSSMPIEEVRAAIKTWGEKEVKSGKNQARIEDTMDCLLAFTDNAETLADALANIDRVFQAAGPIKLMTGHKSKGLEFPHVFILDEHLIDRKHGQDPNLLYVIQTRAQETLTYVTSSGFEG